ncbi:tRNA pseudouridine synthase [Ophiocordyceps camponoti-floridani]|uniref:tRNA pseudouridine synthase 1 n=1 Tax=Ophiocordyceps camponoti-floridani TaxID=2030778 RepID=A0A8H4Q0I4_9HYPO|nr:tRNA pseudouridine synthase [Ophiocordyceps camponoti-floridani]
MASVDETPPSPVEQNKPDAAHDDADDAGRPQDKRSKQQQKKRKKQEEWREFKRRKVDGVDSKNPFSKEEIAAEARRPKRKVAVMIGYAGTGYKGMQVNGDEPTIERDLFRAFIDAGAISKANADDPRKSSLARCARTDKGVHAAGNVISLKLIIEDDAVVANINAHLPDQIRVWGIQRTNNTFNCYQYCDSRWYEYLLPSYCLLPPHPHSYLGRKLAELAAEHGAADELRTSNADLADFWSRVEDQQVRPILAALDPDVRAAVLERAHVTEAEMEETDTGADAQTTVPNETGADAPRPPQSVKPKNNRDLGPVDYALRDIKAAYVTAKRRYRVSPDRLGRLQSALDRFVGTNNFHNYTVQKPFGDASARRHIKSFVANPEPILIGGTEWLSLKVHGQSFMMHQIRKMVGMATLLTRCCTPLDRINDSYADRKLAIPKAPGLGLLLERPVFENYNRRARETLDRPEIDFDKYERELQAFKDKHIYTRIFEVEEKENTFHAFFNQIDQFRSNHFLWLTAGGLSAAEIPQNVGGEVQEDVDKQLGDEDEDPEGGEG